jgi:Signal transduction histidine kinase
VNQQNLQQVDLDRLVARLCADLATCDEPLPVHGKGGSLRVDALLLQRCLQNLVVNALRYARQVSVRWKPPSPACTSTSTTAAPASPLACWPPSPTRSCVAKGHVIRRPVAMAWGLSIAQRIASSHGGELLLRNRDGGGLRVSVLLPR